MNKERERDNEEKVVSNYELKHENPSRKRCSYSYYPKISKKVNGF